MATIRKRGDFQWQAIVKRKGYPLQSKTFNYKADAEKWARLIENEMDRGVFVSRAEAERTTLKEALERYEKEVTERKKGAGRERTRIARWTNHKLAARPLASVRSADLAKFRDEWRKAGKAENTIRLELALLSHLFEVARREWGMEGLQNPVKAITLPGPSRKRDRRLEGDEEARLLAELRKGRNPYAAPAAEFAIETGMRQGEILGLCWADVNYLKDGKGLATLADTKNGESRTVPLSTRAVAVLKSLPRPIEGGRIFRITQDGLVRAFARACERGRKTHAEEYKKSARDPYPGLLEDLRFHDLRHEATSRLFERGDFGMMEVAAITGHKTLHMLKRYTQLRAEDLARKLG